MSLHYQKQSGMWPWSDGCTALWSHFPLHSAKWNMDVLLQFCINCEVCAVIRILHVQKVTPAEIHRSCVQCMNQTSWKMVWSNIGAGNSQEANIVCYAGVGSGKHRHENCLSHWKNDCLVCQNFIKLGRNLLEILYGCGVFPSDLVSDSFYARVLHASDSRDCLVSLFGGRLVRYRHARLSAMLQQIFKQGWWICGKSGYVSLYLQ